MTRQKKRETAIEHIPTVQLMSCLHEENPRDHSWDDDLPKLVRSLLWAGWCELPSYNAANNKLIGGHGRVITCEWLIQQNKEWFAEQWAEYQAGNPTAAAGDRERFSAGYWLKVPVKVSNLDDRTHRAMMIRLNNPAPRGRTDDQLRALILSRLTPAQQDIALPDPALRSQLLARIAQHKQDTAPQIAATLAEQAETGDRVTAALADFEVDQSEPQPIVSTAEGPIDSPTEEPEISEGGAHFNEDPPAGQKRQILYPLAIVLSDRRWRQLQAWKEENKINSDMTALLRGHAAFNDENGDRAL